MHNYRIDFTMNHGHEMTLDKESGIERGELDDIELQMLQGQSIPHLLPIDWLELNGKVTFRYALNGFKMLYHRLQQSPITMQQYYMLILGIIDALDECKHYMLRPEGCMLNEHYIFVGEQLHDIRLAYVPMKESSNHLWRSELLTLVATFTAYVDQIDGEGLKRVLVHLTGQKWPLNSFAYDSAWADR